MTERDRNRDRDRDTGIKDLVVKETCFERAYMW